MNSIIVTDSSRSREDWIQLVNLPKELWERVLATDILIVPSMMFDKPEAFVSGTMELFAYLQSRVGDRVEICIADEDYLEIELNARKLRLGKFLIKEIALPVFVGVLGAYIYDNLKVSNNVNPPVEIQEYQKPTEIDFTIIIEDSTGRRKEFSYDGPAEDYKMVAEEIERLWDEEKN